MSDCRQFGGGMVKCPHDDVIRRDASHCLWHIFKQNEAGIIRTCKIRADTQITDVYRINEESSIWILAAPMSIRESCPTRNSQEKRLNIGAHHIYKSSGCDLSSDQFFIYDSIVGNTIENRVYKLFSEDFHVRLNNSFWNRMDQRLDNEKEYIQRKLRSLPKRVVETIAEEPWTTLAVKIVIGYLNR